MTRRRPGRDPGPARHGRRRTVANEEGLRSLGALVGADDEQAKASVGDVHTAADEPQGSAPGRVANEERLRALGEEIARAEREKSGRRPPVVRTRRRRRLRRGLLIGAAVLLVLVVGGGGYLYYLTHDLNRVDVRGLRGAFTSGKEAGTENILMVGSTSRCARWPCRTPPTACARRV